MSFYSAILSQKSQFIFILVLYISMCVLPKDILSFLALLSLPSFFSFFIFFLNFLLQYVSVLEIYNMFIQKVSIYIS